MRLLRAAIAAALAGPVVVVIGTQDASAYCRTTVDENFAPTDAVPCDTHSRPIAWPTSCVGFDVNQNASVQIDLATARAVVLRQFKTWSGVDCPADLGTCGGAASGHPTITVSDLGPVKCNAAEYNDGAGNQNLITFYDTTWPHTDGASTLALTTVTFSIATGDIYDADIEVNSTPGTPLGDTAANPRVYDFESIIGHESGHFLGLSHTQPANTTSTMYGRYKEGATFMRGRSADDACGMCNVYPPTRKAACDTRPHNGFATECSGNAPATTKSGCHCGVVGNGRLGLGEGAIFGAASALIFGLARRRRRRAA